MPAILKPGTRVRLRHATGFRPAGLTGTVVDLPKSQLNGWELAIQWDTSEPDRPSCWNADELDVLNDQAVTP